MLLTYTDISHSRPNVRVWQRGRMSDARPSLYDLLMAIKPENLTPNAWASRAKVSRSFFTDVRNGTVPKTSTLEKVLGVVGYTMAQFYDLPNAASVAPISEPAPRQKLPFTRGGEAMDVPLLGTAQGSDMEVSEDGTIKFIERMDLSMGNVVDFVRRPESLAARREVYAITVVGDSMADRYWEGDPAYVDPKRQPRAGDFVVVQLRDGHDDVRLALLKKFVRRTSQEIELEQTNPAVRFTVPIADVAAVHRVIPWNEIVFF